MSVAKPKAEMGAAFDPSAVAALADPYAVYDTLRTDSPVYASPKGFWFLSQYADIAAALRDHRFSNRPAPFALLHARHRDRFVAADVAAHLMAFEDGTAHAAIRRPVAAAFGKRLQASRAEIAAKAERVARALPNTSRFDAVEDWAAPTALRTTAAFMGLPSADLPRIAQWSSDFFWMFHAIPDADTMARMNTSVAAFRVYVADLLRAPPLPGLISDLAAAAPEETAALVDNIMLLIADGIENVRAGLAAVLDRFLRHPDRWNDWCHDPTACERAIDEALRLESPGQYQGRITSVPVAIGGHHLRARSIVLLGFGAANRDPAAFADPHRFDPDRRGPRPLTFGTGPHACLGLSLVRVQLGAALPALLARRPADAAPDAPRDWASRPGHRWLRSLPISLQA